MSRKPADVRRRRRTARPRVEHPIDRFLGERVAQEHLITSVAGQFLAMLTATKITRTRYAKLIKSPESSVKRLADGRNMTLRTLATLAHVVGYRVEVRFVANETSKRASTR